MSHGRGVRDIRKLFILNGNRAPSLTPALLPVYPATSCSISEQAMCPMEMCAS